MGEGEGGGEVEVGDDKIRRSSRVNLTVVLFKAVAEFPTVESMKTVGRKSTRVRTERKAGS